MKRGKAFFEKRVLEKHQMTHMDKYECSVCGEKFSKVGGHPLNLSFVELDRQKSEKKGRPHRFLIRFLKDPRAYFSLFVRNSKRFVFDYVLKHFNS